MMTSAESLHRLTQAVEQAGIDIAPTYAEYVQLAFAIATDCGEAGRESFIRLCRLSSKYDATHADRLFTNALKTGHNQVHLGTAFLLAQRAGVKVDPPSSLSEKNAKMQKMQCTPSLTHTRTYIRCEEPTDHEPADSLMEGSEPIIALPTLPPGQWPSLLAESMARGATPAQRDVLLLSTLTALGACMGRHVRCAYGGKMHSPCLQLFVIAPPASGKGVLSFVRKLVEPLHREIRRQVEKEMEAYRKEKAAYDALGKERQHSEPPQTPRNRLFIIPGNNSGTGILQNIIDSDGTGIIFETEADTISTAIGADYGHWSDTLRKAFDHDPLAYNRRVDREFREVDRSYLSVILSGTPAQVKPLIPSAENGLFSRQLFYYMPAICQWQDQFASDNELMETAFERLGREWMAQLKTLKQDGLYEVVLSDGQKADFNRLFASLFAQSAMVHGMEMSGSVARLGIILCRILSVVATLRVLEAGGSTGRSPLIWPASGIPEDNLKDGIVTRWEVHVSDSDFQAVMALVWPLFRHATHVLSFLPGVEVTRRPNADRSAFFDLLPVRFTRHDILEMAKRHDINPNTVLSWLSRLLKKGVLVADGPTGNYRKCSIEADIPI